MEKKKLRCRTTIRLIFILTCLFFFISRMVCGEISTHISEIGIVYTPQRNAIRFHYQVLSSDTFEYWVFKLNNKEETIILNDLKNGNWVEMNSTHIDKLDSLNHYEKIIGKSYKKHKCYICVYDYKNNVIITNNDNDIWQDTTKWIIFLYDTDNKHYYCIFETV